MDKKNSALSGYIKKPDAQKAWQKPKTYFNGLPGRMAIIQGQILIVALVFIIQLWLVTDTLFEALSGDKGRLWTLTIISGICFIITLVVWFLPKRRMQ